MSLKIGKNEALYLLVAYTIGIFVWDYTILYQLPLVLMFGVTFVLYRGNVFGGSVFATSYTALIVYFVFHTLLLGGEGVSYSVQYLITMCINLAAIICVVKLVTTRKKLEFIMRVCIWTTLVLCAYIIIMDIPNLLSGSLGNTVQKPITGGWYTHNDIAFLAAMSIMFLQYFRLSKMKFRGNLVMTAFFLLFIVMTGARRSLMLALVAVAGYPLLFPKLENPTPGRVAKFGFKAALAGGLILVAFGVMLENQFLYDMIGYRFEGFFAGFLGEEFTESSAASRDVMREAALRLIAEKPWLGYGLNTFQTFQGSYSTWSHNNYLELWVSGGIFAVIIYYGSYVYAAIKLLKIKNDKLAGMFFTYMIFAFVNDVMAVAFIDRVPLFMLALVAAFINCTKTEQKTNDNTAGTLEGNNEKRFI